MKFYLKKRRSPSVPIVTLIDILAILLIFFIVTTTFKTKDSLVQVNLWCGRRPKENCSPPTPAESDQD